MNRICCLLCVLALLFVPCLASCEGAGETETVVTVVRAPEQTKAERPSCFPDPTADYIPLPETENYALGKPVLTGGHTDVYVDKNLNDGNTNTYWESRGLPAEVVIDLEGSFAIATAAVCLNTSAIWEPRTQEIAVLVSLDGESYTEVSASAEYRFDAATGNRIRIDFEKVEAAYVKLIITANSAVAAKKSGGAQAAEICIY